MRKLSLILLAGFGVTLATGAAAIAMPWPPAPPHENYMVPAWSFTGECKPLDFDGVEIEYYRGKGIYQLTITGTKPFTNMEVSLSEEPAAGRPAYRKTVVIGCVKNFLVVPLASPYYLTVPLEQFSGTRGIEIIGATRRVRRDLPRR